APNITALLQVYDRALLTYLRTLRAEITRRRHVDCEDNEPDDLLALLTWIEEFLDEAPTDALIDVVVKTPRARPRGTSRRVQWEDAIRDLRELHEEYSAWRDNLPDSQQDTATAEKLNAIADLDIDNTTLAELDVLELPLGFGRD